MSAKRCAVVVTVTSEGDLAAAQQLLVPSGESTRIIERAPEMYVGTVVEANDPGALSREVLAVIPSASVRVRADEPSAAAQSVLNNLARLGTLRPEHTEADRALLRLIFGDTAAIVESIVVVERRKAPLLVTVGLCADDTRVELSTLWNSSALALLARAQSVVDEAIAEGAPVGAGITNDDDELTFSLDADLAAVGVRAWRVAQQ